MPRPDEDDLESMSPEERAESEAYLRSIGRSLGSQEHIYKKRVVNAGRTPGAPPPGPTGPPANIPLPAQRIREESEQRRQSARPPAGGPPKYDSGGPPKFESSSARFGAPASSSALGMDGTFPVGTILRFEDESIGVFKDARADKDYEIVYQLRPDGTAVAEGMELASYEVRVIGRLPPEFVLRLQRRQRWLRDEIVFHLDSFDYCAFIPAVETSSSASKPAPALPQAPASPLQGASFATLAPPTPAAPKLEPGRQVQVSFGPAKQWAAVYWGEDDMGPLVVHQSSGRWALMHLDLNRFADSIVIGDFVDDETRAQIEDEVAAI